MTTPTLKTIRLGRVSELVDLPPRSIKEKWNPASESYDPAFPKPVKLSPQGTLGWYENEIQDWLQRLPRVGVIAGSVDAKPLDERSMTLYCAQYKREASAVLLLNRDYMPLNHKVRNPETEATATYFCRISKALSGYCSAKEKLYFPLHTEDANFVESQRKLFLSSGLYRNRESFLNSLKGDPLKLMLSDVKRMLPYVEFDIFETFILCADFSTGWPKTKQISLDEVLSNMGYGQDEKHVRALISNERFRAVTAHVGATINEASDGTGFVVQAENVYNA